LILCEHGSKSVSLGNIIDAYSKAAGKGKLEEFANDEDELFWQKIWRNRDKLHTALHEVVGTLQGKLILV
jgi:dipeptidyl-peptidase-3